MRISDARRADLKAHEATARKAAKRNAFPHGADDEPIRSGDPAAMQRIVTRIEELALSIDRMKAANGERAFQRRVSIGVQKFAAENVAMLLQAKENKP
ncbi:hypothetical protein ACG873_02215 [Mesorhizobium sp. AaZ16]|uniref:hypothetical protein n=1 Tax=Mesorhizobium sp. AaZ16 TaxID=3402289 RepID=UPI00374FA5C1